LEKYRFAFIPGGVILLALFSLFVFLPKQIKLLRKEFKSVQTTKKEVKDLRNKYLLLSSLDQEELKEQAKTAVLALPEQKSVPQILKGLRESVGEAEFLIRELKFAPGEIQKQTESTTATTDTKKTTKRRVEELPLEAELVGPVDKISQLLTSLETRLPLFEVTNLDLSISQRAGHQGVIDLEVITFYSPPMTAYQESSEIPLDDLVLTEAEQGLLTSLSEYTATEVSLSLPGEPVGTTREATATGIRENPFIR